MDSNTPSESAAANKAHTFAQAVASVVGGVRTFFQRVMLLPMAALLALILLFVAWSCERRSRLEEAEAAAQSKQQAAAETARLQAQVKATVEQANQQHAQAVQEFESQRQSLEREATRLRESLKSLRQKEVARVDELATLPLKQVQMRVAARLGPGGVAAAGSDSATGNASGPLKAATGPQPPDNSATAAAKPESAAAGPAFALTDLGLRNVETAFVQLDACREQSDTLEKQVDNCQQQVSTSASLINQQNLAITKLNTALSDKDRIQAQRDAEQQVELKAARGSLKSRFFGAVKYVAAGVLLGVMLR